MSTETETPGQASTAPDEAAAKPAKAPKLKTSKKPKATKKPAKAKAAKHKAAKKAKAERKPRTKDDARLVAKASGGKLDTSQVRILRALKSGKTATRDDIKEAVGIGRDGKYSQTWLKSLWELNEVNPKLMLIEVYEAAGGQRAKHFHTITKAGKEVLANAEKAAKA